MTGLIPLRDHKDPYARFHVMQGRWAYHKQHCRLCMEGVNCLVESAYARILTRARGALERVMHQY